MAVRRGRPAASKKTTTAKRGRPATGNRANTSTAKNKTASRSSAKKPPQGKRGAPKMDVTEYATKAPTDYHKAFATWIVEEVGYVPKNRKDFLMGVSIATAARPKFMESEFLAEWREKTGETKRGPKPKNAEPVDDDDFEDESEDLEDEESEEDDEFEDDEDESDDDDDDDDDDDESDDDDDEDDDDDDEDDDEDWEDDDDDEEEEPVKPAPKRRASPAKGARRGAAKAAPSRSKASAKSSTRGKAKSNSDDDDDFLF